MSDDEAKAPKAIDNFHPEDWITAQETLRRVTNATLSRTANIAICTRAHAGLIRARADLLTLGGERRESEPIHEEFWWAEGHEALEQNWDTGDFETWIDKRFHMKAFGVRFHREDVRRMAPDGFEPVPILPETKNTGGRTMSRHWPEWVAEVVAYFFEDGTPAGAGTRGADALIDAIESRLQARGKEAPSRSTVQETVNAVPRRMRQT